MQPASLACPQNMQNMLEQLDITKADKALIQEEMKVVSGTPQATPSLHGEG